MLSDHIISKPAGISTYEMHQLLESMTDGARPLFVDLGDRALVRSERPLTNHGTPVPEYSDGDVVGFQLRASCGTRCRGKHRYFRKGDWKSRQEWLERKAANAGFAVLATTITSGFDKIEKKDGKITIDRSDFSGVLRVTDIEKFNETLKFGVSGPAKAFGRGLLVV